MQDLSSTGSNSVPLGRNRTETNRPDAVTAVEEHYDQHVRELAFDQRAKPKDRTKNEEELALEEKEVLEKAERKRIRRMMGDESDSDEDEGKSGGKRKRERGADDLEDDFHEEEEWNGLGVGLQEERTSVVDSSNSEDGGEGEDEDCDKENGENEDESGFHESDTSESEGGDHEDLVPSGKTDTISLEMKVYPTKELPFTYPCPATHEEFLEIIEDIERKDIPTVVLRIRALYHPSLGSDNKFKLQVCPVPTLLNFC
jgi:nucleolar protein 14